MLPMHFGGKFQNVAVAGPREFEQAAPFLNSWKFQKVAVARPREFEMFARFALFPFFFFFH